MDKGASKKMSEDKGMYDYLSEINRIVFNYGTSILIGYLIGTTIILQAIPEFEKVIIDISSIIFKISYIALSYLIGSYIILAVITIIDEIWELIKENKKKKDKLMDSNKKIVLIKYWLESNKSNTEIVNKIWEILKDEKEIHYDDI